MACGVNGMWCEWRGVNGMWCEWRGVNGMWCQRFARGLKTAQARHLPNKASVQHI